MFLTFIRGAYACVIFGYVLCICLYVLLYSKIYQQIKTSGKIFPPKPPPKPKSPSDYKAKPGQKQSKSEETKEQKSQKTTQKAQKTQKESSNKNKKVKTSGTIQHVFAVAAGAAALTAANPSLGTGSHGGLGLGAMLSPTGVIVPGGYTNDLNSLGESSSSGTPGTTNPKKRNTPSSGNPI